MEDGVAVGVSVGGVGVTGVIEAEVVGVRVGVAGSDVGVAVAGIAGVPVEVGENASVCIGVSFASTEK